MSLLRIECGGLVICPGGGFRDIWIDRGGHDLALGLPEHAYTGPPIFARPLAKARHPSCGKVVTALETVIASDSDWNLTDSVGLNESGWIAVNGLKTASGKAPNADLAVGSVLVPISD